jgi:hypothetical protein
MKEAQHKVMYNKMTRMTKSRDMIRRKNEELQRRN